MNGNRPFSAVVLHSFLFASSTWAAGATAVSRPADTTQPTTDQTGDPTSQPSSAKTSAKGLISEEALVRFEQLLRKRPLHKGAFSGLVTQYTEAGKLAELLHEYEQKAAAVPDDMGLQIILARLYLRAGQFEKAVQRIEMVKELPASLRPDESDLLVFKAEVYQRLGRRDDARKMLEQALGKAKSISERFKLSEGVADLDLQAGDRDQAVAALTALVAEFPNNYFHRKRIADSLAQRDLSEAAVEQYRQTLELVKNQTDKQCEVLRQMGAALEKLNRPKEAIETYTQTMGLLAPGHWMQRELHERIVALYRVSGRLDDLIAYCRDQMIRNPAQTSMRMLLSDVLAAAGKVDEAKTTLAEAIELFPKDRSLSDHRLQFLERVADHTGVNAEFERIIAQYPDDVELYIAYGQHLAQTQQVAAARNQWRHVLETKVADAALANRLAGFFELHELLDDAVDCYERAVKLSAESPEAYTALARLWSYRGQKDKALATLKRLGDAHPTDAAAQAALADAYVGLQMNDEALAAISKSCAAAPTEVRYQTIKADLLVVVGKLDESLAVRRAAIDLVKNPQQQIQAIDVLVSMYTSAGKLGDLKAAEEKRLGTNPKELACLLLLARTADIEHDLAAARKWLDVLLAEEPAHEEGRRQLARLYEAIGDIDGAVREYGRIIDSSPARSRICYQAIADLKLRYNDKAGVIEVFDQMVKNAPGNATVLKSAAEQLAQMGELDKAIQYYEESLNVQPDRHEVRLSYAKSLKEAGRLEDALTAYKKVALQRADHESAADALAQLHDTATQLGALEQLIHELEASVESNPEDTLVATTLAELLIREYEYNRAMELIDLVLRQNPRDRNLLLARAELLRRLTRFDESFEAYRRVLRIPGVDRDYVLGELGKTQAEAGQIEQAKATWRQVQHKIYAGSLLQNNGLLTEAIEVYREGIRLQPDEYALHRSLVGALQTAGQTDDALKAAQRLLDLEPDNILNIQQLSRAYVQRGNREEAARVAARLFGVGVGDKKQSYASAVGSSFTRGMPLWMSSLSSMWGGSGGPVRNNLDRAVQFFEENGLIAELEEILTQQLKVQPDSAILKLKASELFTDKFAKPELALQLLKELETATFPLEYQQWLGQSSQRDHLRIKQYQLIASKPALRDARLSDLSKKKESDLTRDEILEFASIRQSQGSTDQAISLLQRAVNADPNDVVAVSVLADSLVRAERYSDAEPHVEKLAKSLSQQREVMQKEMIERVRRDFVRMLPMQYQLRLTDELLHDIAHKWTLGQSFIVDYTGFAQVMGLHRARLTLATIYAKTKRMEQARKIWEDLSPANPADADGWTTLASVAQLHDQSDLAFKYYEKALGAAKLLAGDSLLNMIYGGSMANAWYGESSAIDTSFNKIVEAFSKQNKLIELYDFLRETNQESKASRIAEQYGLYDRLIDTYRQQFDAARKGYRESNQNPLARSVPLFVPACKLAEIYDQKGEWAKALEVYAQYLQDFPDELALIATLGEVAEAQSEYEQALQWERKAVEAKQRLARQAREWTLREISMTPAIPQALGHQQEDRWEWLQRWGKATWGSPGYGQKDLEQYPSWLRMAQLQIGIENLPAAADSMERAIGAAGSDREKLSHQILAIIQQRQLTAKMLSVVRTLAVHMPTDEHIQLAFAESLEANNRNELAAEVYRRMIRRGVSDVGTLARVRQQLDKLQPAQTEAKAETFESLVAEVKADPGNVNNRLRLAKGYYYTLKIDEALETATALEKVAPHLEGLQDLLVEIYTLTGDVEKLIAALRAKIERISDPAERTQLRRRLVEELLASGKTEDAIAALKQMADSKDPSSYQQVGMLLHYFGRHKEAVEQFKTASRSRAGSQFGGPNDNDGNLARSMVLQGDIPGAADEILSAIDMQIRQMSQYGGMAGSFMFDDSGENYFQTYVPLFVLHPELAEAIQGKLEVRRKAKEQDIQTTKLLMQLHRQLGHEKEADAIVSEMTSKSAPDQRLITLQIDRAVKARQFEKAIAMAEEWIAQQPKPTIPPGLPPQFVGLMNLMSARNMMRCRIGDIYWKMGQKDKAFENYHQIIDDKVDETKVAYATICMMRGRVDEAQKLVDAALAQQQVKSPTLLQFHALLAMMANKPDQAFDDLAGAVLAGSGQPNPFSYGQDEGGPAALLASLAQHTDQIDRFVLFLEEQIKKSPAKWENYLSLAQALRDAGKPAEADEVLDRAAQVKALQKKVLEQRITWMEGYASAGQLISLYQQLIEDSEKKVKPQGPSLLGRLFGSGSSSNEEQTDTQPLRDRLGDLLWNAGKRDEARTVWTARMDMKSPQSQLNLAQRYVQKEAFADAEGLFKTVLETTPESTDARRAMAEFAFYRQAYAELVDHLHEMFSKGLGSDSNGSDFASQSRGAGSSEHAWAMDASRDPTVTARLEKDDSPEGADDKLMLATLTGDWKFMESELGGRIKATPYDPMVWTLWARCQERTGNWAEAARAWEFVGRLKKTTISGRHEQLKLVLAGRRVKDAAAGVKDPNAAGATPTASAAPSMMTSYQYFGGYGAAPNANVTRLAGLYVRLKQYDKAERIYLFAETSQLQQVLPNLAFLMRAQEGLPRALELYRFALMLANDTNQLGGYAQMLAEAGKVDEAIELLARAYLFATRQENGDSLSRAMSSMYGGYSGGSNNEGLDSGQEEQAASALREILTRYGKMDATLQKLSAEVQAKPDDFPRAKLLLSLQLRGERWDGALATLEVMLKIKPEDVMLLNGLLHVLMQRGDWDAANKTLDKILTATPEAAEQLRMTQAFLALMKNEPRRAVDAVKPLVSTGAESGDQADQVALLLAVARDHDALRQMLETQKTNNTLSEMGYRLLIALHCMQSRWSEAVELATSQFWEQPLLEAGSIRYRTFTRIVAEAHAAGKADQVKMARPEDQALLRLVLDGPDDAKEDFKKLVQASPDNLNARRGLVLAARMADDIELAATANHELVEWLGSRRLQIWQPADHPPLSLLPDRFIKNMQGSDVDATAVLGMSMAFGQLLTQMMSNNGSVPKAKTYDTLWRVYYQLQPGLLLSSCAVSKAEEILQAQAQLAEAMNKQNEYNQRNRYGYGYGGSYSYADNSGESQFNPVWREPLQEGLFARSLLTELDKQFKAQGPRVAVARWPMLSEICAVLGQQDEARRWQNKMLELKLMQLEATDGPQITPENEYNWGWSWQWSGGMNNQDQEILRSALQVSLRERESQDGEPIRSFMPPVDEVWEWALIDPRIEARLLKLESILQPGWDQSSTMRQLLAFYEAREQWGKKIELIERVIPKAKLPGSAYLPAYMEACYKARDYGRVDDLLQEAVKRFPGAETRIQLARLVLLRKQAKASEADALEKQLVARCRPEPQNPHPLEDRLARELSSENPSAEMYRQYAYQSGYNRNWYGPSVWNASGPNLRTLSALASALGVRYTTPADRDRLTLEEIRSFYEQAGLEADACRLLDQELADGSLTGEERTERLTHKADCLRRAGIKPELIAVRTEIEQFWQNRARQDPADPTPHRMLFELYNAQDAPQPEKALVEVLALKQLDPQYDEGGTTEGHLLYKLGRHAEAWKRFDKAVRSGLLQIQGGSRCLYEAGICAREDGRTKEAEVLLGQALWRDPQHPLAAEAKKGLNGESR